MRCGWIIAVLLAIGCAGSRAERTPWTFTARPAVTDDPPSVSRRPQAALGQGGELTEEVGSAPVSIPIADDGYGGNDVGALPENNGVLALRWPIAAIGVNSLYGERPDPLDGSERFHAGVDLDAPYGSLVYACAGGLVSYAGWNHGHGRQVIVEHLGGYQTIYSHLSQVLVFEGTQVPAGAPIGRVGNSGRSTGPHLHFEVTRYGEHFDPMDVLGKQLRLR